MFFQSYILRISAIMIAVILSFSALAETDSTAQGMDTIILEDASDVPGAVLEGQGFSIPLIINHSGAAASVGLELTPNQVIFARPPRALERRLLRKSKTIGLDLPFKFLVFEDKNGAIKLSVNTLSYLIERHGVRIRDFVLRLTDKLIKQFGTMGGEGYGIVSVESTQSLEDTVQAVQEAISINPAARIPLVLDYGDSDKKRSFRPDRNSFPVLIVFGNPNVGTPLMQSDPLIGIDLPLKFLVWKDHQGQVMISYNNPHFIAGRINLEGQNDRLDAIANALENIAMAGAGNNL